MTIPINKDNNLHTQHAMDVELTNLHNQVLMMMTLVVYQLDQALQAIEDADMNMALNVESRNEEIKAYQITIDSEALNLLALRCPVANDLRAVVTTVKIAVELKKMGEEIVRFAQRIAVLYNPDTSDPNHGLLADIVNIGTQLKVMLEKLRDDYENSIASLAYRMSQYDHECQTEVQEAIGKLLNITILDARIIGRALELMQMLNVLERCSEHCKNTAEYLVFMFDGIDLRHGNQGTQELPVL